MSEELKKEEKKTRKKAAPADIKEKADLYFNQNMSVAEIATQYNTYPKQIERELKRGGYELRTRGAAQKIRLDSGKAPHPTEGKEMSDETKVKISEKLHEAWSNIDDAEMDRRRQMSRDFMNNRPDKDEVVRLGQEAIKKAAVSGSILEKYVADALNMEGYNVLVHQKHAIYDRKMHLDLLLPNERIAIEIDGPAHHEELWADSDLGEIQARDSKKNSLLMLNGYNVIRVKQNQGLSDYFKRTVMAKILETIEIIKANPRPEQLYEI